MAELFRVPVLQAPGAAVALNQRREWARPARLVHAGQQRLVAVTEVFDVLHVELMGSGFEHCTGNVSCGNGINSGGTICGHSFVAENGTAPHAFLANSALVLTDLGTGDDYSVAFDVNDQGVVTGETTRGVSDFSACLWTPTGIRDIGTLGGNRSVGRSINESGQVAGESTTS